MLTETKPASKIETYCRDRRTLLKIKIKSLVDEVKIIKKEENKCPESRPHLLKMMQDHRKTHIRQIMRSTYIAYGLMRGMSYLRIEPKAYEEPKWEAIGKMLESYQLDFDKEKRLLVIANAKEEFKQQTAV